MKKITLSFLTCAMSYMLNAQSFDWTKTIGGTGSDYGNSIAIASDGSIYTTGVFASPTDFDPSSAVFTLTPDGDDIFVQKLDRHGNFVWAFKIGGSGVSGAEAPRGIVIDNLGNILLTGDFQLTVDFDPGPVVNNITSLGNYDFFVTKYTPSGSLVWVKTVGGTNGDNATCIDFDSNNNVIIGGYFFNETTDFNPGTGVNNLTASGRDGFILKLDVSGNFVWVKQFGGSTPDHQVVLSLDIDFSDNITAVGYFTISMDVDPGTPVVTITATSSAYDAFLAKLNSSGTYQWHAGLYGSGNEVAYDVASDNLGNIIYTGYYTSPTVDADPSGSTTTLSNAGGLDLFMIKFSSTGSFTWGITIGSTGSDNGYSINTNSLNQIYLTGFFSGSPDFAPGAGVASMTSSGLADIFIAKYDAAANYLWTKSAGGTGDDIPRSTVIDINENIVTTGWFDGTADLNPDAGIYNITSVGATDVFVMKLYSCTPSMSAMAANFCDSYVSPSGLYTWTNSGVFNDTLMNSTGCDSVLTITLTKLIVDTSTSVSGLTMTSNAATATNYQWMDCNTNLPISGATSQNFTATVNGDYAVIVTMNGCVDTSSCININNVGIDENAFADLKVSPNPTTNIVRIQTGEILKQIFLMDVQGKIVYKKSDLNDTYTEIDLSSFDNGVYILKIINEKTQMNIQKIIKK